MVPPKQAKRMIKVRFLNRWKPSQLYTAEESLPKPPLLLERATDSSYRILREDMAYTSFMMALLYISKLVS